jgi:hypothetical protein
MQTLIGGPKPVRRCDISSVRLSSIMSTLNANFHESCSDICMTRVNFEQGKVGSMQDACGLARGSLLSIWPSSLPACEQNRKYNAKDCSKDSVRAHVLFNFLFRISAPRGYQGRESHTHRSCSYQRVSNIRARRFTISSPSFLLLRVSRHTTSTTPPRKLGQVSPSPQK